MGKQDDLKLPDDPALELLGPLLLRTLVVNM